MSESYINQPIARFIARPSGEVPGQTDLILGTCFRDQGAIKEGRVYELRSTLGTVTLVDIGPSLLEDDYNSRGLGPGWASGVSRILDAWGNHIILTQEEFEDLE